ncbi:unnamed protein product [Moneuplotes crassus]|uniref:Uncharacterized protein n=1 Tax=Euplotes crassus TaxID=5936 RepID=A0AAD1UHF6_EUPCR|nr:unnamed protein product [Moneuplotes crassus]
MLFDPKKLTVFTLGMLLMSLFCMPVMGQKCTCQETGKEYLAQREVGDGFHSINLHLYEDIDQTGDELKVTLADEVDRIVVVVWYNNLYGKWTQNRINQETRGTLMSILKNNHPNVIYHEADISTYNRNAYTYEELADELGIILSDLQYGPTVVVMYDQRGSALRSEKGSLSLVSAVDKEIHRFELEDFGSTNKVCDVDYEIEAMNQFKMYAPWDNYDSYQPDSDEIGHDRHIQKNTAAKGINKDSYHDRIQDHSWVEPKPPTTKKYVLKEPDKSFSDYTRRRRR